MVKLKDTLADLIRKRGGESVVIPDSIVLTAYADRPVVEGANQARKDFSPMQKQYNIDKLLLIDVRTIGFVRTYSAYFPTSEPKATMSGAASLIDLKTHPGLSNAHFQVLEIGKDQVLKPFPP